MPLLSFQTSPKLARLLACAVVLLAGCDWIQLPVTPWARFTAFPLPYIRQSEFESRFAQWKKGNGSWTITYRATSLSNTQLVFRSTGNSSYGPALTGTTATDNQFTPTKAELRNLIDELLATKIFDLYDGYYGAIDQGGGLQGPQIKIEVGGAIKQVAYDEDLSGSTSWEAAAISRASQILRELGLKYINRAGQVVKTPTPAPTAAPVQGVMQPTQGPIAAPTPNGSTVGDRPSASPTASATAKPSPSVSKQ